MKEFLFLVGILIGLFGAFIIFHLANSSHNENLCARFYSNSKQYIECNHRNIYSNIYIVGAKEQK